MFVRMALFTMSAMAVTVVAASAAESGARRCSNATLRGSYGFSAQGFTVPGSPIPAPLQGPFASIGTARYDGRGHVVLTASATFNGLTQSQPAVAGTYSVNADCTFVSTLDNGATFFASIVDGAQQLFVLQTTPGVIASGVASLQTAPHDNDHENRSKKSPNCQATLTGGVYGFISSGTAAAPTVPPPAAGPLAGVGTVRFLPNGSFVLTAVRSVNGFIDAEPLHLTGSYVFTQNCEFDMAFDDVGFHFKATVSDGGDDVRFLETDPGTTFVVHARKM